MRNESKFEILEKASKLIAEGIEVDRIQGLVLFNQIDELEKLIGMLC